ncbi:tetratricopeptide repeat-containing sensor histidine kinase [Pedobacter duraquae]|uniref:histidine kinase n=1 Tax=Pedobacter duraquae TaxID=425511 RepID=A0A4R6IQ93_9SPHI|nr:histidine kinase dimerization/phosphoacceptor domain -containing protein [Pedobacter duraquae]TDO24500.1 two-component sensor histidine kinase [Pedobacter duraquae]
MYKIQLSVLLLLISMVSYGQGNNRNTLSVPKPAEFKPGLLRDSLSRSQQDTGRVWLLNKLAASYWWRQSAGSKDLDSALYYAREGTALSRRLSYKLGEQESVFITVKTLLDLNKVKAAEELTNIARGEQQARLSLVLAEHFHNRPNDKKSNLERSYAYLSKALQVSYAIKSSRWEIESKIALGKFYFSSDNVDKGISYFMEVIKSCQKNGDLSAEAHWWSDLAAYLPAGSRKNAVLQLKYLKNAFRIYRSINNIGQMASCALEISFTFHYELFEIDSARYYAQSAIQLRKESGNRKLYKYYCNLSNVYYDQGNFHQALSYAILAVNNLEEFPDFRWKSEIYIGLGDIYYSLGDYANSLKYYKDIINVLANVDAADGYYIARRIIDNMVALNRMKDAKNFLSSFEKTNSTTDPRLLQHLFAAKGEYYASVGNMNAAELYYKKMIGMDPAAIAYADFNRRNTIAGAKAHYLMARFYIDKKDYRSAASLLNKFETLPNTTSLILKDVALLRFKIDSASGNYHSAIRNYQIYTAYKDSMYNIANTGRIADMQIKYETNQKVKDIKLLQQESLIQKRKISQSTQSRRFAYAAIVMFVIIIGIGYNRYRLKQNSYKMLEEKQHKINEQNESLNSLNLEQEKLIKEKEWLIKEIHHRVKNNMQMMQSLLKSQGYYNGNEDASLAIKTSQHRLQAMSLVHQKLYLDESTDQIEMSGYAHELIEYLKNSFDVKGQINYNLRADNFMLDIARAVPVGLIINELVTNAIKYAFPDNKTGTIEVILTKVEQLITLTISDNGIGMQSEALDDLKDSFGITLIKGLVAQLDGEIMFNSSIGTSATVTFSKT